LEKYLAIVEQQGMLPGVVHYHNLLKAVKQINKRSGMKQIKCFISYAWQPDKQENAALQAKLVKLKGDLTSAGINVMLDIHSMEGDIDHYMINGIQSSDKVLLVSVFSLTFLFHSFSSIVLIYALQG
jgi:SEFIR domain